MTKSPSAEAIVAQLKRARVEFLPYLPDKMTARIVAVAEHDPAFTVIPVSKEDEGVSICSALWFGERRAVMVMQHTGFLDSINNVSRLASEMGQPVVMMVGLLEKEAGVKPTESRRFGIRVTEPMLDLLNIAHVLIERPGDEEQIAGLIDKAYETSKPLAIMIGAEVA